MQNSIFNAESHIRAFLSNIVYVFVAIYGYTDMKLTISKSKKATLYYVQKSYRIVSGKSPTRTLERLGTIAEVEARFGKENTMAAVKKLHQRADEGRYGAQERCHGQIISKYTNSKKRAEKL